jgi:hypothetical protein
LMASRLAVIFASVRLTGASSQHAAMHFCYSTLLTDHHHHLLCCSK